MTRCLSRIANEAEKLYFGDKKHYFYIEFQCEFICDGEICHKCIKKKDTNVQGSRFFDHGLVTGAYTSKSHIFDSPWYHKSVKAYGIPSKDILEKAMEAQKKKRVVKRATVVKKAVVEDNSVKVLPLDKMVESMDEPIQVDSVLQITLRPLTHNGVAYWRDSDREKIYKRLPSGKMDYIGRWDGEGIQRGPPDSDDD